MIRIILGIGLILASIVTLILFLSGGDNVFVADLMTSLTCNPGERFVHEITGSQGGRRQFAYYCEAETSRRDVTEQGVIIGIVGFVVPFLAGLGLFLIGMFALARKRSRAALIGFTTQNAGFQTDALGQRTQFDDVQVSSQSPIQGGRVMMINGRKGKLSDLPPETAKMVEQVLGGMSGMMTMSDFDNQPDLTDKLQQLQEARDKGLITGEEYDRLRKEILDKLGK